MLSEDHGSKRSDGYELDLERTRKFAEQIAISSYNVLARGLERIIGVFPHKAAVAFKPLKRALRAE